MLEKVINEVSVLGSRAGEGGLSLVRYQAGTLLSEVSGGDSP